MAEIASGIILFNPSSRPLLELSRSSVRLLSIQTVHLCIQLPDFTFETNDIKIPDIGPEMKQQGGEGEGE